MKTLFEKHISKCLSLRQYFPCYNREVNKTKKKGNISFRTEIVEFIYKNAFVICLVLTEV